MAYFWQEQRPGEWLAPACGHSLILPGAGALAVAGRLVSPDSPIDRNDSLVLDGRAGGVFNAVPRHAREWRIFGAATLYCRGGGASSGEIGFKKLQSVFCGGAHVGRRCPAHSSCGAGPGRPRLDHPQHRASVF